MIFTILSAWNFFSNFECNQEKEHVQGPSNAPALAPARENALPTIIPPTSGNLLDIIGPYPTTSGNLLDIIGPYPFQSLTGFKWVPKWDLVPSGQASASTP